MANSFILMMGMVMQRRDLDKRKENVGKLKDIISALRSMAALRVQQSQKPVLGMRHYREVVASSIMRFKDYQGYVAKSTKHSSKELLIVFCSEFGFVGGFNRPILKMAHSKATELTDIAIIGMRGKLLAAEYDVDPVWTMSMSSEHTSVQKTIKEIAARLFQAVGEGVSSVKLIYTEQRGADGVLVVYRSLFPVEVQDLPVANMEEELPLLNMPPKKLLSYLTEEYLMASLSCAAMESLHAENHGRLISMDQAHQNIIKKYDQLEHLSRQQWQEEITTELLDIITGFMAQKLT